jgi:hypothetical protein
MRGTCELLEVELCCYFTSSKLELGASSSFAFDIRWEEVEKSENAGNQRIRGGYTRETTREERILGLGSSSILATLPKKNQALYLNAAWSSIIMHDAIIAVISL